MGTFTFNQGQQDYQGEVLNDILTYAVEENETYKEGLIHIKPGIQKRYALPLMQIGKIIQDRKPTPDTSVGEVNMTQRTLEPNDFMVYTEFNPRDWEEYYKPFQPTNNLVFRKLDPRVQTLILRQVLARKDEYINQAIWCSAKPDVKARISSTDVGISEKIIGGENRAGEMKYFNGAIARLLLNGSASAESEDAKGGKFISAGTGSFENGEQVEAELYNMYHALPPHIRKSRNLKFVLDFSTWDKYDQFLSGKVYKYTDNRAENVRLFRGIPVIPMAALPDNTMLLSIFTSGPDSNLWCGVDYANDENVLVVDRLQANSELFFMKMLLKMDVNIVRPGEIVAHLPFKIQ